MGVIAGFIIAAEAEASEYFRSQSGIQLSDMLQANQT